MIDSTVAAQLEEARKALVEKEKEIRRLQTEEQKRIEISVKTHLASLSSISEKLAYLESEKERLTNLKGVDEYFIYSLRAELLEPLSKKITQFKLQTDKRLEDIRPSQRQNYVQSGYFRGYKGILFRREYLDMTDAELREESIRQRLPIKLLRGLFNELAQREDLDSATVSKIYELLLHRYGD